MEQRIQNELTEERREDAALSAPVSAAPTMLTDSKTLNTLTKLANTMAGSQIVPEMYQRNPANCFVACEMANRMGVSPMVVMQNLYIVKGKPAWSGQACIALINGTRLFSPLSFVFVGERDRENWGCYATAKRLSDGAVLNGTIVDMQMAKAEGWMQKAGSKWLTMPEQMLQYRSAAFFARVHCPQALMGLQTVEEVQDVSGYDEPTEKKTIVIQMEGGNEQ